MTFLMTFDFVYIKLIVKYEIFESFRKNDKKVFLNGIAKHFHNPNSLRVPFWSFFNSIWTIWMENQHISLS